MCLSICSGTAGLCRSTSALAPAVNPKTVVPAATSPVTIAPSIIFAPLPIFTPAVIIQQAPIITLSSTTVDSGTKFSLIPGEVSFKNVVRVPIKQFFPIVTPGHTKQKADITVPSPIVAPPISVKVPTLT